MYCLSTTQAEKHQKHDAVKKTEFQKWINLRKQKFPTLTTNTLLQIKNSIPNIISMWKSYKRNK